MSVSEIRLDPSEVVLLGIGTGASFGVAGGLIKAFNDQMINDYAIGFFKTLECVLREASKGAVVGGVITSIIVVCIVGTISSLPGIGSGEIKFAFSPYQMVDEIYHLLKISIKK